MPQGQSLEGYLVPIEAMRGLPGPEALERARWLKKDDLLAPARGYGLISEDGTLTDLDEDAVPKVRDAIRGSPRDHGIRIHVERLDVEGRMRTVAVRELPGQHPEDRWGTGEQWDPWKGMEH